MRKKKIYYPFFLRLTGAILFFTAVCLAFSKVAFSSFAVKAQFFPALDRKAWGVVVAVLILTFLFGRFYCSVICPFGILQDIFSFVSRRKFSCDTNRFLLRYVIAAVSLSAFTAGSVFVIGWAEPYSNFGRIAAFIKNPAYLTGGIVLIGVLGLSVWKKRIFCTSICPVGTLLGLCAKVGLFKLHLSEKCIGCRKCVSVCPSGCVNPDKKELDNERCVRCLKCASVCPVDAIGFKRAAVSSPAETDLSRRGFLTGSVTTAAAVGAGVVFGRRTSEAKKDEKRPIYPPGATTWQEFASKCTHCQLCVVNCKGKVLRSESKEYRTIHLEYGENHCLYDCHRCSSLCPTGAIKPLSLKEKQNRRIGLAEFDTEKCVGCGLCADTCPKGAIQINDDEKTTLSAEKCIGCGACVEACPLPEKAVHVVPVPVQTQIS